MVRPLLRRTLPTNGPEVAWLLVPLFFLASVAGLLAAEQASPAKDSPAKDSSARRPNILLAISDDQSYPYASAYGTSGISTPAFDRVAREGALFHHAMAPSPGCSPTRASLLTGRYPWQNEQAGTHASSFPAKFPTYTKLLQQVGYHVGHTGKGWGPGNFRAGGFTENPAGPAYQVPDVNVPAGIRGTDYTESFRKFLQERETGQPFCFWFGASEPHRPFGWENAKRGGRRLEEAFLPPFLPDHPIVRQDVLDYCFEIEWFDRHLGRMLELLRQLGELDNTLVIVTSDNGMPFPRAKANLYEYGIHVPLAIRWGDRVGGEQEISLPVNLVDLAPTILQAAGVAHPAAYPMAGHSLLPFLLEGDHGWREPVWQQTFAARERHSSSRWQNVGYPQRAVRTDRFLYIRNFHPQRWPAGAPQKLGTGNYPGPTDELGPMHAAYHDIDSSPTLGLLTGRAATEPFSRYLQLAVAHRPAEELFDIRRDPGCLRNLAGSAQSAAIKRDLSRRLTAYLRDTGDPRVTGDGEVFETYRRYSRIRRFPQPAARQ